MTPLPKNWPYPWKPTLWARLRWWWFRLRYRRTYVSFFVESAQGKWIQMEILIERGKPTKRWLDSAPLEPVPAGGHLLSGINFRASSICNIMVAEGP